MTRPTPWLEAGLTAEQRAAAFFPEIGMQGDPGDLAEAFRQHAKDAVNRALSEALHSGDGTYRP